MSIVLPMREKRLANDKAFRVFCAHKAALAVMDYYGVADGIFYLNHSMEFRSERDECLPGRYRVFIDYMPIFSALRGQSEFIYGDDYWNIWKRNKEQIFRGHPVIIGVDSFFLPYHAEYGNSHGAHAVVMYGYDDQRKRAFLLDESCFNGAIDYQQLHLARLSENSWNFSINTGAALRYASLTLSVTDWPAVSNGLIDLHLQESLDYFESADNKANVGYIGLKRMLEQIFRDIQNSEKAPDYYRYVHSQLLPQAQKKQLFQYFLHHINGREGLPQLMDLLGATNRMWNEMLLTILKLAYTSRDRSVLIRDIIDMGVRILRNEAHIHKALKVMSGR